ncbi:uncharacterized protein LOC132314167 [Cornus florida]|uniref:uncharacterized protein LOC132314167 n=1 Tax=Cornus florida TaxID=4283 RepID=UPI0028A0EEB4|nr:uncharacterized protein LOC132314167 [Cornus florida]
MYRDLKEYYWWNNMKREIIEFVTKCLFTIGITPYEALHGRKCRIPLCWGEMGERKLLGPEMIELTTEKVKIIQQHMKVAYDRQKSYVGVQKRRDLEFEVGDFVFLRISL